jgi:hypothetical protein
MDFTNIDLLEFFPFTLCAIMAISACSSQDALLGGVDAGPSGAGGTAGTASVGAGGRGSAGDSSGGAAGSTGGSGGSTGGSAGTTGGNNGLCGDAAAPSPAASCPSNPSAIEGAWCPTSGESCSVCSAGTTCCRHFLVCLPSGCVPPSNCPTCRFRWQQLEAGPCEQGVRCGNRNCSLSEYCLATSGPPPPAGGDPYQYACAPIPSRCAGQATCSCVVPYSNDAGAVSSADNICTQQVGSSDLFGGCSDDGPGQVLVRCNGP